MAVEVINGRLIQDGKPIRPEIGNWEHIMAVRRAEERKKGGGRKKKMSDTNKNQVNRAQLFTVNDRPAEQLLQELEPVVDFGGKRAELACRYDARQGWVVGYVATGTAEWAKLPSGRVSHVDASLPRALWLLKRDLEDLTYEIHSGRDM